MILRFLEKRDGTAVPNAKASKLAVASRGTGDFGIAVACREFDKAGVAYVSRTKLVTSRATIHPQFVAVAGDHLVVVEFRNFSGRISGNAGSGEWVQTVAGESQTFQNPLRKARMFADALAQEMGGTVISMVAMSRHATISDGLPDTLPLDHLSGRLAAVANGKAPDPILVQALSKMSGTVPKRA